MHGSHNHTGSEHNGGAHTDPKYASALRLSVGLNAIMFFVEGGAGLAIGSAALIADAADFLEDTVMYSIGLIAIGWSARARAQLGLAAGIAMGAVGLVALFQVYLRITLGGAPTSWAMAATALVALCVNVTCAWRLAPFRKGDAGMRSIWLSTRNDAALNLMTIGAAGFVAALASGWPDIVAGLIIAGINLWAAGHIIRQALSERRHAPV
jgi:Co/Zn/Cd efflux system component